jgi:DNA-binding beta-propeller fold protein YncE
MNGRPTTSPMIRALGALFLLSGCTASAVDVAPPRYELYFPTGMALSPDEKYLFVLSANSDLRYSSGAVHTVDLDRVDEIAAMHARSEAVDGCTTISARPRMIECPMGPDDQPATFMVPNGSVAVGNFATSVAVQELPDQTLRLFTTIRGDPSVTWMTFEPGAGRMSCDGDGDFHRCGESTRLARLRNDPDFPNLPSEPFSLALAGEHVLVTHFTTGYVSLISAPARSDVEPMLQDTITTLWVASRINGLAGAAGVAPRPNDPSGLVYVTSRQEARVAMVGVATGPLDEDGRPTEALVRSESFFLQGIEQGGLPGDARGIAFSPDGNRLYITSRTPASLQVFDTSLDARGTPRNVQLGALEVCQQPANLSLADFGAGPIVALPCFVDGQVWLVDGTSLRLLAVEEAGRGPTGVVASKRHNKIFVGNYADDTITVIHAAPGSPSQHRAVVRLARPRPL